YLGRELLGVVLLGDGSERIDGAAQELDAGDRDPPLAAVGLQRERRGPDGIARRPDRDPLGHLAPTWDRLGGRFGDRRLGRDAGDRGRGGGPDLNQSGVVEQEEAS